VTAPAWVKGTILLAVTFFGGAIAGVGFERRRTPSHDAARTDSHHVVQRLADHVGLDSAQRSAVAAILARRQGAVDSTWHRMRPHLHATLDSTLREVLAVLRPDQAARFRKMVEEMHPQILR
jgi:hypothetical protein